MLADAIMPAVLDKLLKINLKQKRRISMKNTLYILAGVATFANCVQASLSEKLVANHDQIESLKNNLNSDDFLAQSKCGRTGSCGQACGAK